MKEDIQAILAVAVHAPSGDNSQPWHFAFSGTTLRVWCEPGKDHPKFNVDNRGTYIAHGALIENIKIAAAKHGYTISVQLFPDTQDSELVAAISFTADANANYYPELYDAITRRCTNRKRYDGAPLSITEQSELQSIVGNDGVRVVITPHENVPKISSSSSAGEYVMIHNPELRSLLFHDVRWTIEEEKEVQTGLLVKTLELLPPQEMVFKLLQKPWIANILVALGMPAIIAKDNASVYATSSCYIALVIPEHTDAAYIAVGRTMQLVWLTATRLGLALHPTSGTVFIHQSIQKDGAPYLTNSERERIEDSYQSLYTTLMVGTGEIAMLVRVGHASAPSARCSKKIPQIIFET